jgi:hypothetical protein
MYELARHGTPGARRDMCELAFNVHLHFPHLVPDVDEIRCGRLVRNAAKHLIVLRGRSFLAVQRKLHLGVYRETIRHFKS